MGRRSSSLSLPSILPQLIVLSLIHAVVCATRITQLSKTEPACGKKEISLHSALFANNSTCWVDLESVELPRYSPLYFSLSAGSSKPIGNSDGDGFAMPLSIEGVNGRWLNLTAVDLVAACPGSSLTATGKESDALECLGNDRFLLGGENLSFANVSCQESIVEAVHKTDEPCGPEDQQGRSAYIGWSVVGTLYPQITLCHDEQLEHNYHSTHTLKGPHVKAADHNHNRPAFKDGGFDKTVSGRVAYTKDAQYSAIVAQFGEAEAEKLYDQKYSFLSRGHLAPNGDFALREWQDATFYYPNVAPQWQSFNGGNWVQVESQVRQYASLESVDLLVHTGTLGRLKFNDTELFLGMDEDRKYSLIPVPEFYWKVVYDRNENKAIVFIGRNDPRPALKEIAICPDVCTSAGWKFKHTEDPKKGILICCSYADFQHVVKWVPALDGATSPTILSWPDSHRTD